MITLEQISHLLHDNLQIDHKDFQFTLNSQLIGALPEFDSMAILSVISAIESEYHVHLEDDEISAELFETVESLLTFINNKRAN